MGKLEGEVRAERRWGYLRNAVLGTVGVAGVIAVAAVAPNTLQLLSRFGIQKGLDAKTRTAISRLARKGFVEFEEKRGKKYVRITGLGKQELEKMQRTLELRSIPKRPRRWDKRWRLLVFDIPERRRAVRNRFRYMVKSFGFLRVQGSVWVYPYDCEDLVALMKADLRIGKDVLYAVVERIENDGWIREHFKLRS